MSRARSLRAHPAHGAPSVRLGCGPLNFDMPAPASARPTVLQVTPKAAAMRKECPTGKDVVCGLVFFGAGVRAILVSMQATYVRSQKVLGAGL